MSHQVVWYRVKVQSPSVFQLLDVTEYNWLDKRTGKQVYFCDGLLADVSLVTPAFDDSPVTMITTQQSMAPPGSFLYFTLPEWFPPQGEGFDRDAMMSMGPYPATVNAHNTPALRGDFNPLSSAGGGGGANEPCEDDGYQPTKMEGGTWAGTGLANFDDSPKASSSSSIESSDILKGIQVGAYILIIMAVAMFPLWANFEICKGIGRVATSWTHIFAWLFLGNIPYCMLAGLAVLIISTIFGQKKTGQRSGVLIMVFMFVFSCAFGAPLAWLEAKDKAAEDYLRESAFKQLNCWRNPNERLSMTDHHFIYFEESDWVVDYRLRSTQGVSTLIGQDDEGDDNGKRYNYCVAPIVYRGVPTCKQDLWAVCFRETSNTYLASCDDNDAKTCGWNFASSNNILRTLNRNEEFWSNVEEEDEDQWRKAWSYAPTTMTSPVSRVMGFYSGEGPNEIAALQEEADDLSDNLFIAAMTIYGFFVLVIHGFCTRKGLDSYY